MAQQVQQVVYELRAKLADLEKDMNKADRSVEKSAKSSEAKMTKAFKNVSGEAKGMSSDISSAAGRSEAAIRRAAASGDDLGDKVARGSQRAKDELEDVEKEARSLSSRLSSLDMGDLALGAGAAAGVMSIDSHSQAVARLRAQLGLTEKQQESLGQVAQEVWKGTFGESIGEANQVLGLLYQAGVRNRKQLKGLTEDVFSISDAFEHLGAEPQILIDAFGGLRRAWPGENERAILDRIADSFQKGTGRAGDLQDTIQEYPRYFSDLGLGFEDMMRWFDDGMKAGARWTDVLGDMIKEFGIRIQTDGDTAQLAVKRMFGKDQAQELFGAFGEGGEAGRDAFYEVLKGLKAIDDPTKRYTETVEVFGTMAEDLGRETMRKLTDRMLEAGEATEQSGTATKRLADQYDHVGNRAEAAKRNIEATFINTLGKVAGPVMETAADNLDSLLLGALALKGTGLGGSLAKWGTSLARFAGPGAIAIGAFVGVATAAEKLDEKLGQVFGYGGRDATGDELLALGSRLSEGLRTQLALYGGAITDARKETIEAMVATGDWSGAVKKLEKWLADAAEQEWEHSDAIDSNKRKTLEAKEATDQHSRAAIAQKNALKDSGREVDSTRSKVERFSAAVRDVPRSTKTRIHADASQATRVVDDLVGKLTGMSNRTWTANINANISTGDLAIIRAIPHALGGRARRGELSLVGEQGPELRVEDSDASYVPARQTAQMLARDSSSPVTSSIDLENYVLRVDMMNGVGWFERTLESSLRRKAAV